MITSALLSGLLLGGMYALISMGLTLQYGVARIMNLAYGEMLVAACFAAYWLFSVHAVNPLLGMVLIVPVAFALSWGLYRWLLLPLVRRSKTRGELEVNSILSTFGLLFVIQGAMLSLFGSGFYSFTYLADPIDVLGVPLTTNRILAFILAATLGALLWAGLTRTRLGTAIRAVAVDPVSAGLVAIDVESTAALTFALGGALVAAGGVLVSMFLTFNAGMGVVFTMKALIVVIMGGVGNVLGCLIAGLLLGLAESVVAAAVDPGLTIAVTYALFILVLLVRPAGLFGKAVR